MKSFKSYLEESNLQEKSPLEVLKIKFGKKFNKNYEKAVAWMKQTGKTPADAARMFGGVDARELANMVGR